MVFQRNGGSYPQIESLNLFGTVEAKMQHRDFWNTLMWNLLAQAGHERNVPRPVGRLPVAAPQLPRFEERGRCGVMVTPPEDRCPVSVLT